MKPTTSYARCDFAAQEGNVEILPRFEMPAISFACGEIGPFIPNRPLRVPLWLALHLRITQTCTLRPPMDLTIAELTRLLNLERDDDHNFQPLAYHFFETAYMLLQYAEEDIPDAVEVHRLLRELERMRQSKMHKNFGVLKSGDFPPPGFHVRGFTAPEVELLRANLLHVLNDAVELRRRAAPPTAIQHGGSVSGAGRSTVLDDSQTNMTTTETESRATAAAAAQQPMKRRLRRR